MHEAGADELIGTLSQSLTSHAVSVDSAVMMALPHVTVASGRLIHLVKPLRTRFWLQRAALVDADRLVQQIRAAAKPVEAG